MEESEAQPIIKEVSAVEQPKLMALLNVGLLFRLGGQETFTLKELTDINNDYRGIRMIYDTKNQKVIFTLHANEEAT
jgi:hypothetical protein